MKARRWTLLVVPHGSGGSRQLEVSRWAVRFLTGIVIAIFVGAGLLTYATISTTIDISRLERLERRNEILNEDLSRMELALSQIGDSMETMTTRDYQIRLLAGLEPRDPDVQQAGIGGPAGPMSETDQLLTETDLGQQSLAMRMQLSGLIRRASMLSGSFTEALDTLDRHVDRLSRTPSITPTQGYTTSPFSSRRLHPIYHEYRPHHGMDIVAPRGTPIIAPAGGRVVDVGTQIGYGKIVTINHGNGVSTRYAHCERILVRPGQRVERGENIALVGKTGVATNAHLHYEVLVNGQAVNPQRFIFNNQVVID